MGRRRVFRVLNMLSLLGWCLVGVAWAAAAPAEDCKDARVLYDRARSVAESEPAAALRLLQNVTSQCPTAPHGWFLAGNVHRKLGDHAAARTAYQRAAFVAEAPQAVAIAKANAALASFKVGDRCHAQREFRALVPSPESVPEALREPWEGFVRAAAEADLSADEIACVLDATASDRNLGVCPRVHLRIEFDYDSARIRPDSVARVEALGQALAVLADDAGFFRLIGHTDTRGGTDYNQALSERRAHTVRRAVLAAQDSLSGRLRAEGRGEREPLIAARTEADHDANRRVEVGVLCVPEGEAAQ